MVGHIWSNEPGIHSVGRLSISVRRVIGIKMADEKFHGTWETFDMDNWDNFMKALGKNYTLILRFAWQVWCHARVESSDAGCHVWWQLEGEGGQTFWTCRGLLDCLGGCV